MSCKAAELLAAEQIRRTHAAPHSPEVGGRFTHVRTYARTHVRPDARTITGDAMDKLLLTLIEAARAFGIGRSTVYELMRAGQLESVHIGACRRVPADAVHSFLFQLRGTATA